RDLANKEESTRSNAILQIRGLGSKAKPACLSLITCLADDAESVRFQAYQLLCEWYPAVAEVKKLSSDDTEGRLAAIREVITLLPEVQAAIAAHKPGSQALVQLASLSRKEDPMEKTKKTKPTQTQRGATNLAAPHAHLIRLPEAEARKRAIIAL